MDITAYMHTLGSAARQESRVIARASTSTKNAALLAEEGLEHQPARQEGERTRNDQPADEHAGHGAAVLFDLAIADGVDGHWQRDDGPAAQEVNEGVEAAIEAGDDVASLD